MKSTSSIKDHTHPTEDFRPNAISVRANKVLENHTSSSIDDIEAQIAYLITQIGGPFRTGASSGSIHHDQPDFIVKTLPVADQIADDTGFIKYQAQYAEGGDYNLLKSLARLLAYSSATFVNSIKYAFQLQQNSNALKGSHFTTIPNVRNSTELSGVDDYNAVLRTMIAGLKDLSAFKTNNAKLNSSESTGSNALNLTSRAQNNAAFYSDADWELINIRAREGNNSEHPTSRSGLFLAFGMTEDNFNIWVENYKNNQSTNDLKPSQQFVEDIPELMEMGILTKEKWGESIMQHMDKIQENLQTPRLDSTITHKGHSIKGIFNKAKPQKPTNMKHR